jgi:PAS domain S-box-containing protein
MDGPLQPSVQLDSTGASGDAAPNGNRGSFDSATRSLRLQQAALESTANPIVITDARGVILWTNPAFTTLTGFTAAEAVGETPRILKSGQHDGAFYAELWRTIREGRTWRGEFTNRRRDGQLYYGEQTITPIVSEAGEVTHFVGVMNDITERKRIEAAMRETEARFRQLAENIEEVFWLFDSRKRELLYVSPAYERVWQRSRAELRSEPGAWPVAIHPEDRERVAQAALDLPAKLYNEEYRIVRPDGEVRWIHDRAFPVRAENGEVFRLAGVATDITDRRRGAAALQQAKEQYQSIFQNAIFGICQTTPGGKFLAANPAMARMLGFGSVDELMAVRNDIGRQGYVNPLRREEFKRAVERDGFVSGFEYEIYRKDGSKAWVSENARAVKNQDGTIAYYEGSMTDVSERRRAEERLKLQHAITEALAESGSLERASVRVLEIIGRSLQWRVGEWWKLDPDSNVLRLCEAWHPPSSDFHQAFNANRHVTFVRGASLPGVVWATGQAEWIPDLSSANCARQDLLLSLGLSSWIGFPITLREEVLGVVGFFSAQAHQPDAEMLAMLRALGAQLGQFIERLRLAEQFRHAQKMEALGTLAGGIAHDFNNIIAAISGYSELAKMELGANHVVVRHLEAVMTGSRRAAELVRQILTFSRQHEQERKPIQLRQIVAEAVNLLRATVPATIEFDFRYSRDLPAVLADVTQVHQVVMNLGTNAWHAMREKPGRLQIVLERFHVDEHLAELHAGLRRGDYVRLSVSDTGHGMNRATIERIFEPFFTTKAPGEGTGLGLSVVHGIMEAHEGAVTVYSEPGEGTIFRLYFPPVASDSAEPAAKAPDIPRGHGERILYVDDEQPLADMGKRVLDRLGYVVKAFTSPVEALAALKAHPDQFDLAITDLAMPAMSGIDLAQEILAAQPALPVILMTGFSANHTPASTRALGIREMLIKPLSAHTLGATIASVLAEGKHD